MEASKKMEGDKAHQDRKLELTLMIVFARMHVTHLLHVALLEQIICRKVVSVWHPAHVSVCAPARDREDA